MANFLLTRKSTPTPTRAMIPVLVPAASASLVMVDDPVATV